jgi:hypothetical protein
VVLVFNRKRSHESPARRKTGGGDSDASFEAETDAEVDPDPASPILEISQRNWETHLGNRRRKKLAGIAQPFLSEERTFDADPDPEDADADADYDATNNYYDPAKLTFIFSTPSPLVKKSALLEESDKSSGGQARSPNHSYGDEVPILQISISD